MGVGGRIQPGTKQVAAFMEPAFGGEGRQTDNKEITQLVEAGWGGGGAREEQLPRKGKESDGKLFKNAEKMLLCGCS